MSTESLFPHSLRTLLRPDNLRNPAPVYSAWRETDPFFWFDELRTWVLTRHADCAEVLKRLDRFSSDWRRVGERMPDELIMLQTVDPPEHPPVRRLLAAAYRAQDHAALAERTAERVRRLLAGLGGGTEVEFVHEVAVPLTVQTICDLLGVDPPGLDWLNSVSPPVIDTMDAGLRPEVMPAGIAARAEIDEVIERWMTDHHPGGMFAFVAEKLRSGDVDRRLLLNSLRSTFHAGFESSARLLALSLLAFTDNPGSLQDFPKNPDSGVEELIRYTSQVQVLARACLADTEIGGHKVRAGEGVTLIIGAANRDPAVFADPDTLRLDRAPNPHLGFGRGLHACLGASVASTQTRVLFTELARAGHLVRPRADPVMWDSGTLRGVRSLPVTFT
ncbi:cytochrome P450 [Nonomuraea sp. NPDC048916]|uniref:cytochrome P450 n=1 Tax=Nonomuraea sp. NPDC048916 TaxID=3154232 RepID=UPI0033C14CFF